MRRHNGAEKLFGQNHQNVPESTKKKDQRESIHKMLPHPNPQGKPVGRFMTGSSVSLWCPGVFSDMWWAQRQTTWTNDLDKRYGQAKNSDGLSEGLKTGFCPNGSPEQRGREDKATAEP